MRLRIVGVSLMALGIGATFILLRQLLPPFLAALFLAYLLDPVLDQLEAHGSSRVRAILIVYGLVFAFFASALLILIPVLWDQLQTLQQNYGRYTQDLQRLGRQAKEWTERRALARLPIPQKWRQSLQESLERGWRWWTADSSGTEIEPATPRVAPRVVRMKSWSGRAQISGRVTLAGETDHSFAAVAILGTDHVAYTAADGSYVLDDLPPGSYQLAAQSGSWRAIYPETITLQDGYRVTRVDFQLGGGEAMARSLAGWAARLTAWLGSWLHRLVNSLSVLVMWTLLFLVASYYFLRDYDPLRRRLLYLFPAQHQPLVADLSGQISRVLGGYLRGQLTVCLIVTILTTGALYLCSLIFGLPYWLFLGLFAGLLSLVPYLGMPISTLVATLIALLTAGWGAAIAVPIAMVVINVLSDQVISPRVIGPQVGLHPLLMILAMLAGARLFGILGLVLAAPVVGSVKVVMVHFFPRLTEPLPKEAAAVEEPEAGAAAEGPERVEPEPEESLGEWERTRRSEVMAGEAVAGEDERVCNVRSAVHDG